MSNFIKDAIRDDAIELYNKLAGAGFENTGLPNDEWLDIISNKLTEIYCIGFNAGSMGDRGE